MNLWSNEELARRILPGMPAAPPAPIRQDIKRVPPDPRRGLDRAPLTDARPSTPSRPPAVSAPQLESQGQLSKREVEALFQALRKGTKNHLGREPTISEFQSLVDAVSRARFVASLAAAAISGVLSVYAGANDWEFGVDDEEQPLAA